MAEETFGKRLQRLREAAGMTQAGLADAAGVTVGSLRNWEQDRREPAFSFAVSLADALGASLDALAGKAATANPSAVEPPTEGKPATKRKPGKG